MPAFLALVSLVMNNSSKVSEAKRQAVLHAAEQLGYRPNLHARNLAQARTKTLGMIINDIHNPFFAEVVYGSRPPPTTTASTC